MLSAMRRHSRSFIIYLLFAMIIVVFVFTFNTGGSRGGGCTPPEVPVYAKVSGENVTHDTLVMGMNLLPGLLRTDAGLGFALAAGADLSALYRTDLEDLTPEMAGAMMQVLEMIYLAGNEARRLGFKISEKELAKSLYPESFYKDEEVIGEDGISTTKKVFDRKAFSNWLTYGLHASPQEYEEFVTRVLLAFKLSSFMSGVVKVDPMEAEIAARAKGTKVNLEYVRFSPSDFADQVSVTREEVDKYLAEDEQAVNAWYDEHPADFHTQMGLSLAGIQVLAVKDVPPPKEGEEAAPVKPTSEQMEQAKTKAAQLIEKVQGKLPLADPNAPIEVKAEGTVTIEGKDGKVAEPTDPFERFKEVAKRDSDNAESRDRSGLLPGTFSPDMLKAPPFGEDVAKALEPAAKGDVIGPVATADGYWLFYVTDKTDKKDVTLEQARPEIAEKLLKAKKGPEIAKQKAEELLKAALAAKGDGLEKVISASSPPTLPKEAPAEGGGDGKETEAEKKEGEAETAAEEPKEEESGGKLRVEKTGKFHLATPGKSVPGIGKMEDLFKAAFELTDDAPVADKVFVHPLTNAAYVVRLAEKVAPAEKIPDEDLEAEKESLGATRSLPYFESWLKSLRQTTVEKGDTERTEEFSAFLASLQQRIEEAEQRAAKRAATEKQ